VSEVAVLSVVRPDRADPLRSTLRGLRRDGKPDPFAGERTHFARLVVIELEGPRLLFTSRFDGDERPYLQAIAGAGSAASVWGECEIGGEPTPERVLEHLLDPHVRLQGDYVIRLLEPQVTVAQVRAALALRSRLSAFALRVQEHAPVDLAREFGHEFAELPAGPRRRWP
jgi:hypothetical protein